MRLPHRRDLVAPALFRDLHNFGDAHDDRDDASVFRLCLSSVTARLDPAGHDTPNISVEEVMEGDD